MHARFVRPVIRVNTSNALPSDSELNAFPIRAHGRTHADGESWPISSPFRTGSRREVRTRPDAGQGRAPPARMSARKNAESSQKM